MRPIPAENKRTQLCLQTELAEEKSQSLTEVTVVSTTNLRHERKKVVNLNVIKKFCMQARNI